MNVSDEGSRRVDLAARAGLPAAARRWLDRALPEGFEVPGSIRLEQEGTMEVQGRWTSFKASGVYKGAPLAFNWRARMRMLPGVWIVAEDGHEGGVGWGGARLWGIIPMGKRTDPEVLVSQVVRNLGELPWLPGFALVDASCTWTEAGETAFWVRRSAGGREVMVRFDINEDGDVVRAYSPARPYDVPDGFEDAPWFLEFSEHWEFGGVRMPAVGVASFDKGDGPAEYLRIRIMGAVAGH